MRTVSGGQTRPFPPERGDRPPERLYLWMLTDPRRPRRVGELELVRPSESISLRYAQGWLAQGFALSEDLPLIEQEFSPAERRVAAGAVDDARPGSWGERVIRLVERPPRLSLLEYLYFAGDDRFGALGVSTSAERYLPRRLGPLPTLADAERVHDLIRKVRDNEAVPSQLSSLVSTGAALGGTQPKALLDIHGASWVIKFSDGGPVDTPLLEHATMTLARKAQIRTATTMAVKLAHGHAVAIERFDREAGARRHCLSAAVALRAAAEPCGYPELAQLLRRNGVAEGDRYVADMRELFRRMVFNILMDNTDDHEGNHALMMTNRRRYELSPAYDVLPSGRALGFQRMRVGEREADSTLDNALSMSALFSLRKVDAIREVRLIARVVSGWREHFRKCGVTAGDIDQYAQQIDRPFLKDQRESTRAMSQHG